MTKGIFLDRDGTLIKDKSYLSEPAQVELIDGAKEALQRVKKMGFKVFLFTNQSGVARGYFPLQSVHACNAKMLELLGVSQDFFADICIAIEGPEEEAIYRKPSPRFIQEMLAKHDLVPSECYMVGDRLSDAKSGIHAGIHAIRVETGEPISQDEKALIASGQLKSFPTFLDFVCTLQ